MTDITYHGFTIGTLDYSQSVTVDATLDGQPLTVAIPAAQFAPSDELKALIDAQQP